MNLVMTMKPLRSGNCIRTYTFLSFVVNLISKVLTVCLNVRLLRPNDPNLLKLNLVPFLRLSSVDPSILFQNHPT